MKIKLKTITYHKLGQNDEIEKKSKLYEMAKDKN